jgi:hypothetical protein
MTSSTSVATRRRWLCGTSLMAAAVAMPCIAQTAKSLALKNPVVAQIVDMSQAQQDVSKDFMIGSRAAWQDTNLRGGIGGKQIQHLTLETDGTSASVRTALDSVKNNPLRVALSGSAGDALATQLVTQARQSGLNIAHAAPWLQNSSLELDDNTFAIFAARQEQITYALKTSSVMGLNELGVIFGSVHDQTLYDIEVERIAASMQLKLQAFNAAGELRLLARNMTPRTPAVLLFVGGTRPTAFQKRSPMDIGGFRVNFDQQRRSSTYVTQTMMTLDGRLIGQRINDGLAA